MLVLLFKDRTVLGRYLARRVKSVAEIHLILDDTVEVKYQDGDKQREFIGIAVAETSLPLTVELTAASTLAMTVHADGSRTPHHVDCMEMSTNTPMGDILDTVQATVVKETTWKLTK